MFWWMKRILRRKMRPHILNTPVLVCCSVAQSCPPLCDLMDSNPPRLLCPWDFPGKDTGVGGHFLLQGIFLTRGLNSCFLQWQVDSLPLSHQEGSWADLGATFFSSVTFPSIPIKNSDLESLSKRIGKQEN